MDDHQLTFRWVCQCDTSEPDEDYSTADARLWHALRELFTCVSWAKTARDDAVAYRDYLYTKIRAMTETERETISYSSGKNVQRAESEVVRLEAELEAVRQKEAARREAP